MGAIRDWTFKQLTGSGQKTLVLSGYAAPFGRPRQKPVVETSTELRQKQTRYAGTDRTVPPTTHLFGVKKEPMELSGRWMDKHLGAGSAERNVRAFEEMINDRRPVRITWGALLSYTGWLEKITARWEGIGQDFNGNAVAECAWTLRILVDTDDFDGYVPTVAPLRSPAQVADDIQKWLNAAIVPLPKSLPSLDAVTGELFDQLDDMVAKVTQFGGAAVKLANSISNIETATFNEIERLRAGLHQFKTAVLTLQETVDNVAVDSLVIDRAVTDDIEWLSFKSKSDQHTTALVDTITKTDSAAEAVATLRIKTTYQAKPGDSWESISLDMYGTADRAADIRAANGVKGGEKPVPGRSYNIPR